MCTFVFLCGKISRKDSQSFRRDSQRFLFLVLSFEVSSLQVFKCQVFKFQVSGFKFQVSSFRFILRQRSLPIRCVNNRILAPSPLERAGVRLLMCTIGFISRKVAKPQN